MITRVPAVAPPLVFDSISVRKLTAWVNPPELPDEEELLEDELLDEELLEDELLVLPLSPPPPPPQATSAKVTRHTDKRCPRAWDVGVFGFIVIPV